jgi:hypothetical protein
VVLASNKKDWPEPVFLIATFDAYLLNRLLVGIALVYEAFYGYDCKTRERVAETLEFFVRQFTVRGNQRPTFFKAQERCVNVFTQLSIAASCFVVLVRPGPFRHQ